MQKIVPHLWFDTQAVEAAKFYTSVFPDSKITLQTVMDGTPSGSVDVVNFEIYGYKFASISAGPYFKINPSISFLISCETKEEVDSLWAKLSPGGTALMELASYPFSERFGWIQDKFGVSWQIIFTEKAEHKITPMVMFVGDIYGKGEEAMNFYVSIFKDSKIENILRWGKDEAPDKEGAVKRGDFILENQKFALIESAYDHKFSLNEAISFIVNCKDQAEIDYYWNKLSAVPESEQCGWLKDKFGLSWQIVPVEMDEMMASGDKAAIARVTESFLKMKKFDVAELKRAFEGK